MERISKEEYYLNIAKAVAGRSPCSRRKIGSVITNEGCIISTGYNGSARGSLNCGIDIPCLKDIHNEDHYSSYRYCSSVHSEMNAIINAARGNSSTVGGTLYLSPIDGMGNRPCHLCRREIINSGIKDCFYYDVNGDICHEYVKDWIKLENNWMLDLCNNKIGNEV